MLGHLLMGASSMYTGDIASGRAHLDRAVALYDPMEHCPLATPFGQDIGWEIYSIGRWPCGYSAMPRPHA